MGSARGGEPTMSNFIFEANIAHYNDLLASETDARKIGMIRKLLAEEEVKFAAWRAKNPNPKAAE